MAKFSSSGKIPKRIGTLIIYPLNGEYIIREKSGFSKEGMKDDPKYAQCRENASEFVKNEGSFTAFQYDRTKVISVLSVE